MTTRPISADGLLVLLTVAESGSINSAADILHVSQPSLTRTVRDFEIRLGERIFERGSKGVTLTPLGAVLMDRVKALRAEMKQLQQTVERFRLDRRNAVRLGAVSVHPILQFSQAIVECSEAFQDVHISIVTGTQEEMLQALNEGRVEMVFGKLLHSADYPLLRQDVLYHDQAGVYCRAGHALARQPSVRLADLAQAQWVLGPPGSMMRSRVDHMLAEHDLAPNVAIEVEEVPLRRTLVPESDLLSAFQVHHVHELVRDGRMVRLPIQMEPQGQPIGALRLTEHSEFSRRLLDSLLRRYRESGFDNRSPAKARPASAA